MRYRRWPARSPAQTCSRAFPPREKGMKPTAAPPMSVPPPPPPMQMAAQQEGAGDSTAPARQRYPVLIWSLDRTRIAVTIPFRSHHARPARRAGQPAPGRPGCPLDYSIVPVASKRRCGPARWALMGDRRGVALLRGALPAPCRSRHIPVPTGPHFGVSRGKRGCCRWAAGTRSAGGQTARNACPRTVAALRAPLGQERGRRDGIALMERVACAARRAGDALSPMRAHKEGSGEVMDVGNIGRNPRL